MRSRPAAPLGDQSFTRWEKGHAPRFGEAIGDRHDAEDRPLAAMNLGLHGRGRRPSDDYRAADNGQEITTPHRPLQPQKAAADRTSCLNVRVMSHVIGTIPSRSRTTLGGRSR
jgi:hypothetical protein